MDGLKLWKRSGVLPPRCFKLDGVFTADQKERKSRTWQAFRPTLPPPIDRPGLAASPTLLGTMNCGGNKALAIWVYGITNLEVKTMARGKSKNTIEIIEACKEILAETSPATVRGICYQLFTRGLVANMSDKKETDKISRILTKAREDGEIDWDDIVDETSASGEQRSDTISWIGSGAASFRPPSHRQ
jgi:hypothetical protein